ncbi:NADH-cytochrome b5 reductase-like isoform X4 [Pseudorca crassidens]|uniref:NADH-cytochrome b5 reductase-like n=1 Tax=Tursiops truncatus TaxID=9739 RepID=A0A6J3S6L4_TURTR|nr:NADH-cytochrome b5 reductase-like isoform X6 [Globicephala melas]XP_033722171.1 NADH-cytochrome b5 reductase-like isoform X6 [Tursiops truncatus]
MKSREKEQPGVLRDQAGKGGGPGPALGRAPSCPHLLPDQGPLTMDKGEEDDDEEAWLQLRPVEPLPSQCCGSGCSPCVFDLYQRDLASWEAARASKDRSLLSGEETQSCPSKLSPETFLAFCISATDRLTKDTYLVRFALPGNSRLGLRPGQHLILRGIVDGLEIQRAYTPISPANAKGYFEVLIKCYQTGLMSQYVESWKAGDTAFWRGPFGGFFYKPNQENSLEQLPWSYRDKTHFGRLGQDLIEELVGSCRRKPFALVCGSAEFTKDVAGYLLSAGLAEDSYFLF